MSKPPDRRPGLVSWHNRLNRLELVMTVAVVVALLLLIIVEGLREPRSIERCRIGYTRARTAADTLAVDRLFIENRSFKGVTFLRPQNCRTSRGGPDLEPVVDKRPANVRVP